MSEALPVLTDAQVREWFANLPTQDFAGKRVLLIIPDATRTAPLPLLFDAARRLKIRRIRRGGRVGRRYAEQNDRPLAFVFLVGTGFALQIRPSLFTTLLDAQKIEFQKK